MPNVTALADIDDDELATLLREHGSQRALAAALNTPYSTLKDTLSRRGITQATPAAQPGRAHRAKPQLTRDQLHAALLPPNNCRVKQFRDTLDPDSQDVLDEALGYDRRDFPASRVRDLLLAAGFKETDVPGVDALNSHRAGARPCRCKG